MPAYRLFNGEPGLPLSPPFKSYRLVTRYYPLPANIQRLQRFCDEYINFTNDAARIPEEAGRFVAFLPYVFLIFLDHPHLEVCSQHRNWFRQRELTFGFPVEWYRKRAGRWRFEGWVFVNPFIYLDSSLGLTTGRELQGWPKKMATFEDVTTSRGSSGGRPCSIRMSTSVANMPADPARLVPHLLLELTERRDPRRGDLFQNWLAAAANTTFRMWGGLARTLGPGVFPTDPLIQLDRWRTFITSAADFGIVTLKQFRDAADPETVAYQALIHSVMRTQRLRACGFVGPGSVYAGDLSGGQRILIHHYDSEPIVERLGLRVDKGAAADGAPVSSLTPIAPFWTDSDISYEGGAVVCERTHDSSWSLRGHEGRPQGGTRANPYNETRGPSTECLPGPSELKDVLLRVLTLRADASAVKRVSDAYCLDAGQTVRPWAGGNEVYVIVAGGEETSGGPVPKAWPFRSLGFYLPVDCGGRLAFISPLELVDNAITAISGRERVGRNIWQGDFHGSWVNAESRDHGSLLVNAQTSVFPGKGVQAQNADLVEIRSTPNRLGNLPRWRVRVATGGSFSLNAVHLKQYRDTVHPDRAVYQCMVGETIRVTRVRESGELPGMSLRAYRYEMFSIVSDILGTEPVVPSSGLWLRADVRVESER
jgi:hypothetical protein